MKIRCCLVFSLLLLNVANAAWKVDLNHPDMSLYERGDEAYIELKSTDGSSDVPSFALYDQDGKQLKTLPTAVQDGESWKIALPTDRLGYFEARPDGSDAEQIIPALGTRPAGRLTFAVVEKNSDNPSNDFKDSYLSIQGTTLIGKKDGRFFGWDAYPYIGFQSWGIGYHWGDLEADGPGTFEKNIANDPYPKWVKDAKCMPYFEINDMPMWAADASRLPEKERDAKITQRIPPKDFAQYEAFLEKLIPYIVKSYDFLPERTYEVLWEPDIPWGWHGTPEEAVKVFEVASRVIHKYDPHGKVAGPTLGGLTDFENYEDLLKAGLGQYIDVVAFHTYIGYPPETANIPVSMQHIRELTKKYAGKELPFIGTECGFAKAGTPLNQGYALAATVLIFKGEGSSKQTLFYLSDYADEPGYGMNFNLIPGGPYGPSKISPKPGVPMVRAAIDEIGDADVVGKLDYLGSQIWGYIYQDRKSKTLIAAIWDATDRNRKISFDTGAKEVDLVDQYGNHQTTQTAGGKVDLQLGRGATYVRGISDELYGPGRIASLLDTPEVWKIFRGHKATEKVGFTREMGKDQATLSFDTATEINPGRFQAPATVRKGNNITVEFDVAPTAPLGPAVGYVRVREAGSTLYSGIQRLEVVPELEISPLGTKHDAGKWTAVAQVKNVSPYSWNGKADLKVGDQDPQSQPLTLAAGETKEVSFDGPADEVTHNIGGNLTLLSDAGFSLEQKGELTFFVLPKKPAGDDFWSKLQMVDLPASADTIWKLYPSADYPYNGPSDLSASIGYAYDDKNVYVQVVVHDDIHRQDASPDRTWSEDSVQLAFDANPNHQESGNQLADTNERATSEWSIAFTTRGPEIYANGVPAGSVIPQSSVVTFPNATLQGGPQDGVTTYRITMPWKLIDPKNKHGKQLGIAAGINDSDRASEPSDRKGLEFFGGILKEKNKALFGKAFLEQAVAPASASAPATAKP